MGVGNALLVFIFIVSFFFFVLLMLAIMPNYGFFIFCLIDSILLINIVVNKVCNYLVMTLF